MATGDFNLLPEDCVAAIVKLTSPKDACRLGLVSKTFLSAAESDPVWENFLPPDYDQIVVRSDSGDSLLLHYSSKKELYLHLADHPLLIDGSTKSFWLEKSSGNKCYLMSARSIKIIWTCTPRYWRWTSIQKSRFPDVAQLLLVWWLEITGKLSTSLLSPRTDYGAYLVYWLTGDDYGFSPPVKACVTISGEKTKTRDVYLEPKDYNKHVEGLLVDDESHWSWKQIMQRGMKWRTNISDAHLEKMNKPLKKIGDDSNPEFRRDGWLEIKIGTFNSGNGEDEVEMSIMEIKRLYSKRGLIVEGIEVRPEHNAGV